MTDSKSMTEKDKYDKYGKYAMYVIFVLYMLWVLITKPEVLAFLLSLRSAWIDTAFFVLLYCLACVAFKEKIDDDNDASTFVAFAGLFLLIVFVGVMFSDHISNFLQVGFGVNSPNHESGTPSKKAVLDFLGLGIGGAIAAYGLIAFNKRANAQIRANEVAEKRNIQEKFNTSVEHLGSEQSSVRIASFYELLHLAKNKKDDYAEIAFSVLCSHMQNRSVYKEKAEKEEEAEKEAMRVEMQPLIEVLFSKDAQDTFGEFSYNLQGVNLRYIRFESDKTCMPEKPIDFSFAKLSYATLNGINLSGFIFTEAELIGATLYEAELIGATLYEVDLSGAKLSGAKLSDADLTSADLSDADLTGADLSDADLTSADLTSANLTGADLSDAKLSGAKLSNAKLPRANLSNADLFGTNLSNAKLRRANFSNADLFDTDLSNADLSGANFSNAGLFGANLSNAKLRRANLSNTDLFDANLSNANLSGAKYNTKTRFPAGFSIPESMEKID